VGVGGGEGGLVVGTRLARFLFFKDFLILSRFPVLKVEIS